MVTEPAKERGPVDAERCGYSVGIPAGRNAGGNDVPYPACLIASGFLPQSDRLRHRRRTHQPSPQDWLAFDVYHRQAAGRHQACGGTCPLIFHYVQFNDSQCAVRT